MSKDLWIGILIGLILSCSFINLAIAVRNGDPAERANKAQLNLRPPSASVKLGKRRWSPQYRNVRKGK